MWGSVGVGICRDLRYPELALHYGKEGVLIASIMIVVYGDHCRV